MIHNLEKQKKKNIDDLNWWTSVFVKHTALIFIKIILGNLTVYKIFF